MEANHHRLQFCSLLVQQATGSKRAMFESNVAVAFSFHEADQKCVEHPRRRFYYQPSLVFTLKKTTFSDHCFPVIVPQWSTTVLFLLFSFSSSNDDISYTPLPMIFSFASIAVVFLIIICCCVCPCCCLYKMCRKPRRKSPTSAPTRFWSTRSRRWAESDLQCDRQSGNSVLILYDERKSCALC